MLSLVEGGVSSIGPGPEAEYSSGVAPSLKPIKRSRSNVSVMVDKLHGLASTCVSPSSQAKSPPRNYHEQRSTGSFEGMMESVSKRFSSPLDFGGWLRWRIRNYEPSPLSRGIVCAAGIYFFYLLYGILQERLCKTRYKHNGKEESFKFHIFLIFCQCVTSAIFSALWTWLWGSDILFEKNQLQAFIDFAFTSFSYVSAIICSNVALRFIDYPTQVLGKSCKMLPVMFAGVLLNSARYTVLEYLLVFMVSAGISCFTYANHLGGSIAMPAGAANPGLLKASLSDSGLEQPSGFVYAGPALLIASLLLDGLTGASQDILVVKHQPTSCQLMTFQNLWGALFSMLVLLATGEGASGFIFFLRHRAALLDLCMFSVCSAIGQFFIFLCVRQFGSLVCATITTTRKFFSILCSVLWFGHTLSLLHWTGVMLVFCGILGKIFAGKSPLTDTKVVMTRELSRDFGRTRGRANWL